MAKKIKASAKRRTVSQRKRPGTTGAGAVRVQNNTHPAPEAQAARPVRQAAYSSGRAVGAQGARMVEASQQYRYVLSDLVQLGITAAVMFVVLFVLALIIR